MVLFMFCYICICCDELYNIRYNISKVITKEFYESLFLRWSNIKYRSSLVRCWNSKLKNVNTWQNT